MMVFLSKKEFLGVTTDASIYDELRRRFPLSEVQYVSSEKKETVFKVYVNAQNCQYVLWDGPIKDTERAANVVNKVYKTVRKAFFTKEDKKRFPSVVIKT